MKPTIGRVVHFVQKRPAGYGEGLVHVPAIIVAVWGPETVNLQVFTDRGNSESYDDPPNTKWVTSVGYDETGSQPRTWHWPEREEAAGLTRLTGSGPA